MKNFDMELTRFFKEDINKMKIFSTAFKSVVQEQYGAQTLIIKMKVLPIRVPLNTYNRQGKRSFGQY